MLQELQSQRERPLSVFGESMRQRAGLVALAIAVAIAYFLASQEDATQFRRSAGGYVPDGP